MNVPLSDRILTGAANPGDLPSPRHNAPDVALAPPAGPNASTPASTVGAFSLRMADFYNRVDAAIAAHRPTCWNRGACCQFAAYGHRLYVTEPELRYFALGQAADRRIPADDADACPYHTAGHCTARTHRPLGCRIFFCDESAQAWQGPEYERFLAELKAIGGSFDLPYAYREWLSALRDWPTDPIAPVTIVGP